MLPKSGCWSVRGMPQNTHRYGLMKSKSTFSPEESKSRILRGYYGGQSINRPIKVRIVGPTAYPRMHIRLRRPSQVIRRLPKGGGSQYHESRVPYSTEDTILLGSVRPRTIKTRSCYNRTSELCHHWRWDNRPRVRKKRQINIYNYSCLCINYLSTNSLAALMWRWYLNSKEAAFQLPIRSSRRC